MSATVEKEEEEKKYLNEHERELENEGHLPQLVQHREVSKPHISRKMRAMLKKAGQESVNIRELVQNVEAKEPEEVCDGPKDET